MALLNVRPRFLENSFLALNSVLNKQNVLCFAQINSIEGNIPDLNTKNLIEAQKTVC